MRGEPTSLRVLAVNGQDPAIYQRFEAIGHPLPVTSVRLSTGPRGRWIDQPTDHLPTPAELDELAEDPWDEQLDLRLEEEHFDPGDDDEPGEWWE
jgi:hypothetical protein